MGKPSPHIESGTGAAVPLPPDADAEPLGELLTPDDELPAEAGPLAVPQYVGSSTHSWLWVPWPPAPSGCCCWLVGTCAATGDVAKSSAIMNASFIPNPSPSRGVARLARILKLKRLCPQMFQYDENLT
jgi:hypothetical protein